MDEPYRMFTSRAEYRILLRQDNADMRLTPYAQKYGLASSKRTERLEQKKKEIGLIEDFCRNFPVKAAKINPFLESVGTTPLAGGTRIFDLINRPQLSLASLSSEIEDFKKLLDSITEEKEETMEAAEIEMKYHGYIARERALADKMQRLEDIRIANHFNYEKITQLSTEARQKLSAIKPETLAQASRIPGVSPSDISVLLVLLGR